MERKQNLLILLFTVAALVSFAGFFNSYLRLLSNANMFPLVIHIHFIAFVFWFALLIVQPVLIRRKSYSLHKRLGRSSYFLAPVLVMTILVLISQKFQRELPVSEKNASITLLVGLLDVVSFSICYIIAILNKRNVRWHVAFMIGATLIILNPGMSRLLNQIQAGLGLPISVILPFIIPTSIMIIEKIKYKRPVRKSPFLLFLVLWSIEIILFITLPDTSFWKYFVAIAKS